jgi:hypothetical protein
MCFAYERIACHNLFLCSSFLSPLAKRLFFFQTFVVPEWEPVGTAVFAPLAASERLKKRVIGWKFLPGTSPVASVPGYSLRSLSLGYASPPIALHLRFLHCSLPVCLIDYSLVCVCVVFENGGLLYENGGLGI